MSKSPYRLQISFKSNERPFSASHDPARHIVSDDDALAWHASFEESMGSQYTVTLFKDEVVLKQSTRPVSIEASDAAG